MLINEECYPGHLSNGEEWECRKFSGNFDKERKKYECIVLEGT
jgi:hypothetical protein